MEDIKIDKKKVKVHKVLTCNVDHSVQQIAQILKKNKVFVVDDEAVLQGIITTTDLVYNALAENKTSLKAADIMEKNVGSINMNDPLDKAFGIMNTHKTYVCAITDKGKLLGVISYHDIVGYIVSNTREE